MMNKNYLNTIFPFLETTTKKEREVIILISASVILFVICFILAYLLLPKYCDLFSNNELHPFACDGLRNWELEPCPICENKAVATVASFIFGLGICFFFLPFVVFAIRNLRNRPVEQTKLFD